MPVNKEASFSPPRSPGEIPWRYSVAELRADAVIHVLGIGLAIVGSVSLTASMWNEPRAAAIAVAIYLATLLVSIVTSAAYNIWPVSGFKWLLRRFDHAAIYLLIAGTYTPLTVKIGMWRLLSLVWLVAAAGVAIKLFQPGRFDRIAIALYLALGWSGVLVFDRLVASLPSSVLWLIGTGGLIYSFGVVFHVWERLPFQNAIWHGFVLTAASIHYVAIWTAMLGDLGLP